ncbi:TonB-dependent receptor [Aquimarina sp. TRL1]|uniref:TonB-dependent receptor n=1 Tax=Aquimarina sp. (strain TRL1) TaxID=2736252 RepID=UPI00158BD24E|nr:TonB-dependent receptor [Aquimarina sp. TRL1]QKX05471.1 TonB-dependent receptor [Aquimarina sp. TRL1]
MYPRYFVLIFLFLISPPLLSQSALSGKITDKHGQLLPGASVLIKGTTIGAISDINGYFELSKTPLGNYQLEVSMLGFKKEIVTVFLQKGKPLFLSISLSETSQNLDEIVLQSKSKVQRKREEPIKIEVIDVKKIQAQSISLPQIMNQTSGVKVRQNGGIGSGTSININGLQGNAIRFFKDGIPLDYLGRAFDLSMVPIDQLTNIEIYKGVLPVDLGADALGGAVNFISQNNHKNHLDLSYGVASFNTHQVNLNGYLTIPNSKFFAAATSYFITSDNNYTINVDIPDADTGVLKSTEAERFHDGIYSLFLETKIGTRATKIADLFEIGFSRFDMQKELQNNIRLTIPYGEAIYEEDASIFTIRYQKQFDKLHLDFFTAYSDRNTLFDDTPTYRYNWLGEPLPIPDNDNGGETNQNAKSYRRLNFDNWTIRANANYQLHENHQLNFNHNYIYEKRVGSDPLAETFGRDVDVLTFPAKYTRNITGIGVTSSFLGNKIDNVFSVKRYGVITSSISSVYDYYGEVPEFSDDSYGISNSMKYNINKHRYLRISYERATRIPESEEYFGDAIFISGNYNLQPETSHNINLGFYSNITKKQNLWLDINTFYRAIENNIFLRPFSLLYSRYQNTDDARILGGEFMLKGSLVKNIRFNLAVTYQDIRRKNTDINSRLLEDSRQPNIPYFFGNIGLRYHPKKLIGKGNWQFYGNYNYVEKYLLNAVSKEQEPPLFGDVNGITGVNIIPTQNLIDIGITYKVSGTPLWVNAEINNILDAEAFDGFRVQKPGINYRLKIKYSIN